MLYREKVGDLYVPYVLDMLAARVLGQIGPKASAHTAVLAEMLTDRDEETRLASAQALLTGTGYRQIMWDYV